MAPSAAYNVFMNGVRKNQRMKPNSIKTTNAAKMAPPYMVKSIFVWAAAGTQTATNIVREAEIHTATHTATHTYSHSHTATQPHTHTHTHTHNPVPHLKGEQRQPDHAAKSHDHGQQHDVGFVEGADDAGEVSSAQGERPEKDVVHGHFATWAIAAHQRAHERDPGPANTHTHTHTRTHTHTHTHTQTHTAQHIVCPTCPSIRHEVLPRTPNAQPVGAGSDVHEHIRDPQRGWVFLHILLDRGVFGEQQDATEHNEQLRCQDSVHLATRRT